MIKRGETAAALEFAERELAPRGEESPEYLGELERTMALLAFEGAPNPPAGIAELLSPAQRLKTAGEVNAAILESLSQDKEVKLVGLLKLQHWGEKLLDEKVDFPKASHPHSAADAAKLNGIGSSALWQTSFVVVAMKCCLTKHRSRPTHHHHRRPLFTSSSLSLSSLACTPPQCQRTSDRHAAKRSSSSPTPILAIQTTPMSPIVDHSQRPSVRRTHILTHLIAHTIHIHAPSRL